MTLARRSTKRHIMKTYYCFPRISFFYDGVHYRLGDFVRIKKHKRAIFRIDHLLYPEPAFTAADMKAPDDVHERVDQKIPVLHVKLTRFKFRSILLLLCCSVCVCVSVCVWPSTEYFVYRKQSEREIICTGETIEVSSICQSSITTLFGSISAPSFH